MAALVKPSVFEKDTKINFLWEFYQFVAKGLKRFFKNLSTLARTHDNKKLSVYKKQIGKINFFNTILSSTP